MSDTSTSKPLGSPVPFMFEGKDYPLSPLAYDDQAKFEYFLERRAVEALERQRRTMPPDDYTALYLSLIGDIALGKYAFGGKVCAESAKSVPGLKELFFISISKLNPTVTREFVDQIFMAKAAEASATIGGVNADPFVKTEKEPTTP